MRGNRRPRPWLNLALAPPVPPLYVRSQLKRRFAVSTPRASACLAFSLIALVSVTGASLTAFADADEAAAPTVESPEHRAAQQFVTRLVQGSVKHAVEAAGVPFVLLNNTVANTEDLSAKLGDLGKSRTFAMLREMDQKKGLRITKVEALQEPRLSLVAGRSFQPLEMDGLSLVLVRSEGNVGGEKGVFDFVVAVKPGGNPGSGPQIVGFGED